MRQYYDVIVVGAGPAGSTAAKCLADQGYRVLLIDRANFPRHKTCASWINRLAFERFSYLQDRLPELVQAQFYGIEFVEADFRRSAKVIEAQPCGYLSLRSKFDDGLRRIALEAGAEFLGGMAVREVEPAVREVVVSLADGCKLGARVLVGADGASSRVAVAAGIRKGWSEADYVICANEDAEYPPENIAQFYGEQFPIYVFLQYRGIQGYGWVFPKHEHICVGIGGRLRERRDIRALYTQFFSDLKRTGRLPADLCSRKVYYDLDPVGAVHRMESLTRGRVVLVGDAGGFVSGSTGEGIYSGMVSAEVAAEIINRAFKNGRVEETLARFNEAWRRELGQYVRRLPGGQQEEKTKSRIGLIFRSSLVSRLAARAFLYGEPLSLKTALKCLW